MNNRIVFFAHYDPEGLIDPYVVYYLEQLLSVGVSEIWFASDCNLKPHEEMKLPATIHIAGKHRHGEYDFGSWKRCLKACGINHLQSYDELILCNDSCYGPLQPFTRMLEEMDLRPCDFWGVTQVEYFGRYFPSYFLGIRNQILKDSSFISFLEQVFIFENKQDFCKKYEVGLYEMLLKKGYEGSCYLGQYDHLCHSAAMALSERVMDAGMLFLRVMTIKSNPGGIIQLGQKIKDICVKTGYPFDLIIRHVERTHPGYKKSLSYLIGDTNKTYGRILKVRMKPKPAQDKVSIKVRFLGITVYYGHRPMRYSENCY